MGLMNPTFTEEGPSPGSAKGWRLSSSVRGVRLAAFVPSPERAREDFERWGTFTTVFTAGALVLAFFGKKPEGRETFEHWGSGVFLAELGPALLMAAPLGPTAGESWDWAAPFLTGWPDVVAEPATFAAGAAVEAFASWVATPAPVFASAPLSADGAETFTAGGWPALTTL